MRFKLFETEIYVSFLFVAVLVFMLITDRTGLILPTLFAVAVHELGHLFAMWLTECAPSSVRLIPASVQIVRRFSMKTHSEAAIALCGPLCNIAVFASFGLHYLVFGGDNILRFALLNLILGAFNLLPVRGLDGGTLLLIALEKRMDEYAAERAVRLLTLSFALAVCIIGIITAFKGRFNISVFIAALYLAITALMKR